MLLLIEPMGQVLIALIFQFDIVFEFFFFPSWVCDCHEQLSETNVLILPLPLA